MNTNLTQIKYISLVAVDKAKNEIHDNWIRLVVLLLLGCVLVMKDIRFSFSLKSIRGTQNSTEQIAERNGIVAPKSTAAIAPIKTQKKAEASILKMPTTSIISMMKIDEIEQDEEEESLSLLSNISSLFTPENIENYIYKNPSTSSSNVYLFLTDNYMENDDLDEEVMSEKRQICENYISQFAPIAISELKIYDVPASITLAQALLESDAGESRLAQRNNNHFGIKCFSKTCQDGHCNNLSSASHKDFFRKYGSTWESYRAHSLFLQRQRYQYLFDLKATDYKSWAYGLAESGYNTDKAYAKKIIRLVNEFNLTQYDE